MKIAVTMYPLDQLGGIVSNIENQLWGFKELGHEVDLFLLAWQNKFVKPRFTDKELIARKDGWYKGFFCAVHQSNGWNLPLDRKLAYKGKKNLRHVKKILSKYDLVIWQIPVPTRQKVNRGNTDWMELYYANDVNIAYSHDAHMINFYPYIYEIKDRLVGLASTNVASYFSTKLGGIQKALIFSSHNISKSKEVYDYDKRKDGWLSLQTFKAWKHVDDLLRAVPYMEEMKMYLAGSGREHAYMTSKDKCKPEYFARRKEDPDLSSQVERKNLRIWGRAIEHGMQPLKWIEPKRRDRILQRVKLLIDPSWNLNFANHGDHFNRVFTDAMLMGNIPVGRNYGVTTNKEGQGLIFKADENYIMIPHDVTPKVFAEVVNSANNLPRKTWRKILKNNYNKLKGFCRKNSAQQFINLAKGKPAGFFQDRKVLPNTDPKVISGSTKMMREFFGMTTTKKHKEGIGRYI